MKAWTKKVDTFLKLCNGLKFSDIYMSWDDVFIHLKEGVEVGELNHTNL